MRVEIIRSGHLHYGQEFQVGVTAGEQRDVTEAVGRRMIADGWAVAVVDGLRQVMRHTDSHSGRYG